MSKNKGTKRYGLSRAHTKSHARDLLDMDYLSKLSPAELEWLDRFSREFYQSSFTNTVNDLHQSKTAERRALYNADNARRRDMWNQSNRMPLDLTDSTDLEDDDK